MKPPPRASRPEAWIAAAGFALLAALYLARPISLASTHVFANVDAVAQQWSATRELGYAGAKNRVLLDPAVQFQPWARLQASELEAGRWPLWNPYNGAGVPLLANYQSATFSPFTLPHYLFGERAGLILAALLKVGAAGLFAFLFLRTIGLGRGAAAFGALGVAFSGFELVWIQYPHTAVIACLPAALYFSERALREIEGDKGRATAASCAGLALSLAAAILAGHPETLFFCAAIVLAYCGVRLGILATRRGERARAFRGCVALACVALVATGLGACQLAPFLEYLGHSAVIGAERHAGEALDARQWAALVFPNLAGTPADGSGFAYNLPAPNYQELAAFRVASAFAWLAVAGAPLWWRDARARFFAALALAWLVYAWDAFGLAGWLTSATPLGRILVVRTHPLWIVPICALGAISIDAIGRAQRPGAWALAVAACGVAFALAARAGAAAFFRFAAGEVGLDPPQMSDAIASHVRFVTACIAVSIVAAVGIAWFRSRWLTRASWAALALAALLESALPFRDYVPTVPERMEYPCTEAVAELLEHTAGERVLFLTPDAPIADANVAFGLPLVSSYDAMSVAEHSRLANELFGDTRQTLFAKRRGLELYGVRYVVTHGQWLPIDTGLGDVFLPLPRATPYLLPEIQSDRPPEAFEPLAVGSQLALEFEVPRDGLDAACVGFLDDPAALDRRVEVALRTVADGASLFERTLALRDLPPLLGRRRELVLEISPRAHSAGERLHLSIRAHDGGAGAGIRVLRSRAGRGYARTQPKGAAAAGEPPPKPVGELALDGVPIEGHLALDLAYGRSAFRHVARVGAQELFEFTPSRGRAWFVGRARGASSGEEAWRAVLAEDFDPFAEVVIEGPAVVEGSLESNGPGAVTILEHTPSSWRLRVRSESPGYLVLAQTYFPGWTASVAGARSDVLRANYALSAVDVPAGEHEVVLEYRPASFRFGGAASLACALAGVAVLSISARRRKRTAGRR